MKFDRRTISRMNKLLIASSTAFMVTACSGPPVREMSGKIEQEEIIAHARPVIAESLKNGARSATGDKVKDLQRRTYISRQNFNNYTDLKNGLDDGSEDFEISMNLDRVELREAIEMFAQLIGRNIVVGDEVGGVIDLRLVNVSWKKALTTILSSKGLAMHVDPDSGIIRVHSRDALIAQESFEKDRIERLRKNEQLREQVQPVDTEIFRVFYADLETLSTQVKEVVGASASEQADNNSVSISVDQRQKSLIVKAPEEKMQVVAELIEALDQPTKQVLIEAFIVEASKNFNQALGAELGLSKTSTFGGGEADYTVGGTSGDGGLLGSALVPAQTVFGDLNPAGEAFPITSGLGLLLNSSSAQLKLALTALEKDSIGKTLSNPKVFTLDTVKASISQGTETRVVVPQDGDTNTTEADPAVLKLDVTPTVVGDGNVILEVVLDNDSKISTDTKSTMQLQTKLLVPDRGIVVIGGIFKDVESQSDGKVPFFGDLPLLGRFFRSDADSDSRTELLIFIAPHVI
jgi:type IV pilus assembly protein PilQ